MRFVEWVRASQAILFEASIVPAVVGTAAAVRAGAAFQAWILLLILLSLVGIQAGANLFKGYYEGRDRSSPPSSPGSWFAFDSAAATNLTRDPRAVLHLGRVSFAIGAGAGLLLVVLTMKPILLLFGLAGALLAWSYSSPPLQLSYRGMGEVPTFLAFGPIMTVGATLASGGVGLRDSLFGSLVLGCLASAISFGRYFPNRSEDMRKGKRTPVTLLGFQVARRLFLLLTLAPIPLGIVWSFSGGRVVWIFVAFAFGIAILRAFPRAEGAARFDRAIAWTVAAHAAVGLGIAAEFFFAL